jgi:hypothetical protein
VSQGVSLGHLYPVTTRRWLAGNSQAVLAILTLSSTQRGVCLQTHRLLRGKALECVSLVGMAVGRDRFRQDAARVLAWLQVGSIAPLMLAIMLVVFNCCQSAQTLIVQCAMRAVILLGSMAVFHQ